MSCTKRCCYKDANVALLSTPQSLIPYYPAISALLACDDLQAVGHAGKHVVSLQAL
jgi:hypothetical protein